MEAVRQRDFERGFDRGAGGDPIELDQRCDRRRDAADLPMRNRSAKSDTTENTEQKQRTHRKISDLRL